MPDWQTEALPVLRIIYQDGEGTDLGVDVTSDLVARKLGRPPDDQRTLRTLDHLRRAGYISAEFEGGEYGMFEIAMEPEGLKHVAGWPGSPEAAAANFLTVLQDAIDSASPEERGKLERLRDSALTVGQSTLAGVLAKVLTSA